LLQGLDVFAGEPCRFPLRGGGGDGFFKIVEILEQAPKCGWADAWRP